MYISGNYIHLNLTTTTTLNKGQKTLGKVVAEFRARQRGLGREQVGKVCFAECFFTGTQQSREKTLLSADNRNSANKSRRQNGTNGATATCHRCFAEFMHSAKAAWLCRVLHWANIFIRIFKKKSPAHAAAREEDASMRDESGHRAWWRRWRRTWHLASTVGGAVARRRLPSRAHAAAVRCGLRALLPRVGCCCLPAVCM